jgi:hypothetical protein
MGRLDLGRAAVVSRNLEVALYLLRRSMIFRGIGRIPLIGGLGGFGACSGSGTGSHEADSGVMARSGREEERCLLAVIYCVERNIEHWLQRATGFTCILMQCKTPGRGSRLSQK